MIVATESEMQSSISELESLLSTLGNLALEEDEQLTRAIVP